MNFNRWPTNVALIAVGTGWLGLAGENVSCHAQVLRSSLPIHFDDRDEVAETPQIVLTDAAVAQASALESNQASPPTLPVPSANKGQQAPQLLKPDESKTDDNKPGSGTKQEPASPRKPTPRKSYVPEQKPISQISIDVSSKSKAGSSLRPENVAGTAAEELPAVMGATAGEMHLGWMASAQRTGEFFPYKPLYFEEVNLERYGRSAGFWQPAISTTRFFATVPLLPYKMAAHSPHRAYYWNWPYAAGASAPQVRETFPIQPKAAIVEASVLTGAAFLIP